jgi:hypothetical protein
VVLLSPAGSKVVCPIRLQQCLHYLHVVGGGGSGSGK